MYYLKFDSSIWPFMDLGILMENKCGNDTTTDKLPQPSIVNFQHKHFRILLVGLFEHDSAEELNECLCDNI